MVTFQIFIIIIINFMNGLLQPDETSVVSFIDSLLFCQNSRNLLLLMVGVILFFLFFQILVNIEFYIETSRR